MFFMQNHVCMYKQKVWLDNRLDTFFSRASIDPPFISKLWPGKLPRVVWLPNFVLQKEDICVWCWFFSVQDMYILCTYVDFSCCCLDFYKCRNYIHIHACRPSFAFWAQIFSWKKNRHHLCASTTLLQSSKYTRLVWVSCHTSFEMVNVIHTTFQTLVPIQSGISQFWILPNF